MTCIGRRDENKIEKGILSSSEYSSYFTSHQNTCPAPCHEEEVAQKHCDEITNASQMQQTAAIKVLSLWQLQSGLRP
jgi:hypothetical protein